MLPPKSIGPVIFNPRGSELLQQGEKNNTPYLIRRKMGGNKNQTEMFCLLKSSLARSQILAILAFLELINGTLLSLSFSQTLSLPHLPIISFQLMAMSKEEEIKQRGLRLQVSPQYTCLKEGVDYHLPVLWMAPEI